MAYRRVRERGIVFYFKYDDQHPELLHIFVRHLTDIDDALDVFFDRTAVMNGAMSISGGSPSRQPTCCTGSGWRTGRRC